MKRKKPLVKPFKPRAMHNTRFVKLKFVTEARMIRDMTRYFSNASRKAPLSDRLKMRSIISSLEKSAARLEGKA